MKRTICLKLIITKEQAELLFELQQIFSSACNEIAGKALENKTYNRVQLHHLVYYRLRQQFPHLGSQMICNAIQKVSCAYKILACKKGWEKAPKIIFHNSSSVHYDKRTYTLKNQNLSLFTIKGRIQVSFKLNPLQCSLYEQGNFKEAELIHKKKGWFLNLVLDLPDHPRSQNKGVMGIDLGENNLAALSTGKVFGGGKLRNQRDKYLALRCRLQSNGSPSAKQLLKKVSGRERRHVQHVNHEISKEIVANAIQNEMGTIVMEDLTNIRKRIKGGLRERTRLHRWAFRQLQKFIEYKAQAAGFDVLYVCPAYSSKICSSCHQIGKRSKHLFCCPSCGNRQHSDLNSSQNLCWFVQSADRTTCAVNRTHVGMDNHLL